ncbi:tRNA (guanosine(37)-N1)-methyltransferase TrmD [Mesoplasma lactucae]|uniref:tRNA (guanine-N(1)-)-methyltransferase n=1 Tax=Mesoplasma lactucae ATCC 49193 TaxID=81460 RepID=A0A291IQV1_9MOLU|nr:tRNA (guanosine(37)-N1)-methyltransferase TrmD [Mesoplasma lactucae]ATG97315.1 tRNA (guanosine(37)-N1)-methyltransferase TrmD [Mesoplasma lactucae ATCC 49193]ATZ20234.1 tRNA (guanosine(37)-N1)-methyltransferase [Mesoplasma lactucae ATCC 49193]MCL8216983.1 tRNA (guanine-N(1)-)-methyltransferase [Mesoplasma lactucae ATCC 49193]
MKFSILTLFPKVIYSYIEESIIKKAIDEKKIEVEVVDIRDFTNLKHNQVDDYQYGGGKGMVLMPEPVVAAIESVKTANSFTILTSPQGKTWNQKQARQFANDYDHLIIVCGHYEGFDRRILDYVDMEISIGDYVLTGGELASLVMVDSITRVVPDVIQTESHLNESFENNLLDYDVYTKPVEWRGKKVPEVLLSGHHKNIDEFREKSSLENTLTKRPDLIDENKLSDYQKKLLKELKTKGDK